LKRFQLQKRVPEGIKGNIFALAKKEIRDFLCLLSAQLFSCHSRGPESEER
jgi:hypothetical protein